METDEDKKRKLKSINAGHRYIVNIKSLLSKSPLQKYTFVLEFQTRKLDLADNSSASLQNSATGGSTMREL